MPDIKVIRLDKERQQLVITAIISGCSSTNVAKFLHTNCQNVCDIRKKYKLRVKDYDKKNGYADSKYAIEQDGYIYNPISYKDASVLLLDFHQSYLEKHSKKDISKTQILHRCPECGYLLTGATCLKCELESGLRSGKIVRTKKSVRKGELKLELEGDDYKRYLEILDMRAKRQYEEVVTFNVG